MANMSDGVEMTLPSTSAEDGGSDFDVEEGRQTGMQSPVVNLLSSIDSEIIHVDISMDSILPQAYSSGGSNLKLGSASSSSGEDDIVCGEESKTIESAAQNSKSGNEGDGVDEIAESRMSTEEESVMEFNSNSFSGSKNEPSVPDVRTNVNTGGGNDDRVNVVEETEDGSSTESTVLPNTNAKLRKGNMAYDEGDCRFKKSLKEEDLIVDTEEPTVRKLFYRVSENPSIGNTLIYALQQLLTSFSRTLTVSMLVAELVCGQDDQALKTRLLATTALCNGLSTILMSTIGVRLPIYQGPATAYIVPLIAMMSIKEFSCPDRHSFSPGVVNGSNETGPSYYEKYTEKRLQMLSGSLMLAGLFQTVVGLTGLMGFLLRFVGPVTIVPTLTIVGLYLYTAVTKFMSTHWGIAALTSVTAVFCALYLRNVRLPLPWWTRKKGFHLVRSYFHRSLSILIALVTGWIFSAILTVAGAMSDDPRSEEFKARPDSQLSVLSETNWFMFPYPGQFGTPSLNAAVVASFILASISAILDSVGDYYACSRACFVPPPPASAVSRGIMVEGIMSAFAGACGIGHATTSFGGNIGVISITKVASRRVFVVLGFMYIFLALFGKLGAVFVTIPLAVLGGVQLISFGIFVGVIISNLQYIDLRSTRNLAIMGISMLIGLVLPNWASNNPDSLDTGVRELNDIVKLLLANPFFASGILSCFLDNTVPVDNCHAYKTGLACSYPPPVCGSVDSCGSVNRSWKAGSIISRASAGTLEERGLLAWLVDDATLKAEDSGKQNGVPPGLEEGSDVYDLPFLPHAIRWGKISNHIPIMPGYSFTKGKRSVLDALTKKPNKTK